MAHERVTTRVMSKTKNNDNNPLAKNEASHPHLMVVQGMIRE